METGLAQGALPALVFQFGRGERIPTAVLTAGNIRVFSHVTAVKIGDVHRKVEFALRVHVGSLTILLTGKSAEACAQALFCRLARLAFVLATFPKNEFLVLKSEEI